MALREALAADPVAMLDLSTSAGSDSPGSPVFDAALRTWILDEDAEDAGDIDILALTDALLV